jgi:hypothetical protein
MRLLVMLAAAAACGVASAQALPTEFPADAAVLSNDALRERMAGKTFTGRVANGNGWRLEYMANGFFFMNAGDGFADKGKWHVQDGKLCSEGARIPANCSEVRVKGDTVYLKRISNGEVVALTSK